MRFFWNLYLKILGWKAANPFPHHIKKAVLIVGPHTSWRDFIIGLAFRSVLKIRNGKFLGKAELFKGPFGFFFRWVGGTPVDRFSQQGVVEQVVDKFMKAERLYIALSPEGTRKKVDKLRTGFYFIAKEARVPVIMVGFDYEKKELSIADPLYVTDNEEEDFRKILDFFGLVRGFHPENGLSHLVSRNINKE